MFDFARLSRAELEAMAACGRQVFDCERALAQAGRSLLSEAIGGAGRSGRAWLFAVAGNMIIDDRRSAYRHKTAACSS